MLSYPAGYVETLASSHQAIVEADVLVEGDPIFVDLPVVDGSITVDRTAGVRRSAKLTIRPDVELIPEINGSGVLSVYGNEIAIRRGIAVAGYVDPERGDGFWRVPLGVFRIAEPALAGGGSFEFSVAGYDRSMSITDRVFLAPWKVATGSLITTVAQDIVQSRLPGIPMRVASVAAQTPALAFDTGADPWKSLADLCGNAGLEAYFDGEGNFVISWQPDPASDPVWTYQSGDGLLSATRNVADSKPISAVLLTSEQSQETTPIRVLEVDNDPSSPTYALSTAYGIVPEVVSIETTLGVEQAQARARTILRDKLGTDEKISLSVIPNQALQEGDVIHATYDQIGMDGHYIIDQIEIPLSVKNSMTISGRRRVAGASGRGVILGGPYSVADWNSVAQATAKTTSSPVSWTADDRIIVMGATWDTNTLGTPTATGLTFSTVGSAVSGASTCWGRIWSATAAAAGTSLVSVTPGASCRFGFLVWVASNTGGLGNNSTGGTTAQTISLTRSGNNSAVLELIADFAAGSTSGHTWTPTDVTERWAAQYLKAEDSTDVYTIYAAEWPNQGIAGAASYGVSVTASGGNYSKLAVEVLSK